MDVMEAALLKISCVVIARIATGKMLPLVMPLLLDNTKKKALVILPLYKRT